MMLALVDFSLAMLQMLAVLPPFPMLQCNLVQPLQPSLLPRVSGRAPETSFGSFRLSSVRSTKDRPFWYVSVKSNQTAELW